MCRRERVQSVDELRIVCRDVSQRAASGSSRQQADAKPVADALPLYRQMSQLLIDEVAYIPLYYTVGAFMFKPYVKGAGTNNFFDYWWNQISILQH